MPKKKQLDDLEQDELLTTLISFRQSVGWRWFEKQVKIFEEQVLKDLLGGETKKTDDYLKGELNCYRTVLKVLDKRIEDLTLPPPKQVNVDPYAKNPGGNPLPRS